VRQSKLDLPHAGFFYNSAMPGINAFLGDSITNGGRWDRLFPGVRTANFGVDGDCSQHVLARLEPVIALGPARLFLMIGTNDLGWGGVVEDVIVANVTRILDRLRAGLPECRLHLQSVLPREAEYAQRVISLNRCYAPLAAGKGAAWIDLFPRFDGGGGVLRAALGSDGLHLSEAGYALWREAIADRVS
jgi:lysophospholipase L1-like esterase